MSPLFKKLNFKDQPVVHVLNAPASFMTEAQLVASLASVKSSVEANEDVVFAIAFATKQREVDDFAARVAPVLKGDAVFWIAYPKGTSKKYTCEFNRDTGWVALGGHGLEPVRQVAIDEDWSALRFRKVAYIKKITRNDGMILSEEGKNKKKK